MVEEVETGDVFRTAYLVSRGARVTKAIVQGGDHVVLTMVGEDLVDEDRRYRTAAGLVEPLRLKENLNRLRDLVITSHRPSEARFWMGRNFFKGIYGDMANVILAASAMNLVNWMSRLFASVLFFIQAVRNRLTAPTVPRMKFHGCF
jgi:hypothetical protein